MAEQSNIWWQGMDGIRQRSNQEAREIHSLDRRSCSQDKHNWNTPQSYGKIFSFGTEFYFCE